jgi:hypothetical protein
MRGTYRLLALIALSGFYSVSTAAAVTIANGDFENPVQAPGTYGTYTSFPGWTTSKFGVELRNNVAGQAYQGNNFVELDTTQNSFISQVVTTTPAQAYSLSFAYSPRANVLATSNGIEAFWNGSSLGIFTGTTFSWTLHTFGVIGTGSDILKFVAVGTSDSFGGSLDAVSIATAAVPGPVLGAGLPGLAMAMGGLIAWRRRRTATA